MAGLLTFSQFIGGPDNIEVESVFPSNQKTVTYNFGTTITNWTFAIEAQTVVADQITFNVVTGEPNFAGTTLKGYFTATVISTSSYVDIISSSSGIVAVTFPANLYSGPIIPDARQNTPITIISVTWNDNLTPPTVQSHRWAFVQSWEPGVTPGDPTLDSGYTAVSVGF